MNNKLKFIYILTATCSHSYVENSKHHKKVILPIITSPKCQCAAE